LKERLRESNQCHEDSVSKALVLVVTTFVFSNLFPGVIAPVEGTAFDLRKPVELGTHLQDYHIHGFDHNFCLKESKEKKFCARLGLGS
jgi:hypothetical protein